MRPRPCLVPSVRPVPQVYRPSRRVSPKRIPGIWTLRPDSISAALRAFFWRHRMLEAALISFIMAAGGFVATWWALWGWR